MSDGKIIIDTLLDPHGLEKGLGSIDQIATKGLKVFAGAVVASGTALGGLGLAGIKLASDLTEVQNVVDVTFGDNAKVINEWAKAAANAFGMSELDAKKFNGTMGAMLKSMGLNSGEVLNMSESMVGLAGDFASFYNLEHQDAFDKIRSGISGETEPLKQLGINMSVANLEAFALTQGITKQYKEMNQAEQATLRYNYLMGASADAQSDFARTSDGLANQMRIAKLNMQSLGAEIGKSLLPVAQSAVKAFNEFGDKLRAALQSDEMKSNIQTIAEGLGSLVEKIVELASEWLPKIIEGFSWIIENSNSIMAGIIGIGTAMMVLNVANMIMGVVKAFQAAKLITEGLTVSQWLLNIAMAANPIGIVIAIIVGLIAALVYLWNTNEGFRNAVIGAWNAIKEAGVSVWQWLVKFFTEDIPNAWNSVVEFFIGIPQWFSDLITNIKQSFIDGWTAIWTWLGAAVTWYIDTLIQFWSTLPEKIGYCLGYVLGTIVQWGINVWNFITVTIPSIIADIVKYFSELPGKIQIWLLQSIVNIAIWGTNLYNTSISWISNTINSIIEWFRQLPGRIGTCLSNVISNIATWGSNMYRQGIQAARDLVDSIVNTISSLPGQIYDIGANIVEGLWNGITSMGSWISNKVSGFFSGIVDGAKDALGIHSPSRVFRDQVGKYMAQGVGVGFEDETEHIKGDMNKNLTDLTAKMTATVNYETSKTSQGITAGTTKKISENNDKSISEAPSRMKTIIEVPVYIEGKEVARATAPYQDEFEKWNEGR